MPQTVLASRADVPVIEKYGWKVTRIFEDFKGPIGILHTLVKHRYPAPAETTIRMWQSRGRIPAAWLPVLILAARDENITRNVFDWIKEETTDPFK